MEQILKAKDNVFTTINRNRGNISFKELGNTTGLDFCRLSNVIGLLLRDNKLKVIVNEMELCDKFYKTREEEIFDKFIALLSSNIPQQRSVHFYAGQLCITPKYFSSIIHKASGKKPLEWIRRKTIEYIKYRLLHSQESIKEIANNCNFPNTSFFGKYFKNSEGISPGEYRLKHIKG